MSFTSNNFKIFWIVRSGMGLRIEYLGIGMTIEEQLSWVCEEDTQTANALSANTRELLALRVHPSDHKAQRGPDTHTEDRSRVGSSRVSRRRT